MKKLKTIFFGIFIFFVGFVSAHVGDDSYTHHDMMSGSWSYGVFGMGFFGWIILCLLLVVIVLIIILLLGKIKEDEEKRKSKRRRNH